MKPKTGDKLELLNGFVVTVIKTTTRRIYAEDKEIGYTLVFEKKGACLRAEHHSPLEIKRIPTAQLSNFRVKK